MGFPLAGVQAKVINESNGESLGPNEPGELCVKKEGMMLGYYKDPKKTKAAFDSEGSYCIGTLA